MIDIKVPTVGESISEVTLLKWTKQEGEYVERDEVIAELESEKATFEVNAEKSGTLKRLSAEGDTILIGSILAQIDDTAPKPEAAATPAPAAKAALTPAKINQALVTAVSNDIKATPVASAIICPFPLRRFNVSIVSGGIYV